MDKEERKRLVHIGRMDEKRKMDGTCLKLAYEWLEEALRIDNLPLDRTVTFTDEERDHLHESQRILWKKRNELREWGKNHYEEMMESIYVNRGSNE